MDGRFVTVRYFQTAPCSYLSSFKPYMLTSPFLVRLAFQTAVALAVFDSKLAREKRGAAAADEEDNVPEIKERHLGQVVSMSATFKEYMVSTHEGIEDSDYAYKLGLRNDSFGPPGSKDNQSRSLGGGRARG